MTDERNCERCTRVVGRGGQHRSHGGPSRPGQPDTEWRESHYSLVLQNKYLMDTGLHSDCSFTVGLPGEETHVFQAHRFMLSRASPVFEAMFHSDMSETHSGEVRVTDVHPRIFKLMLRYVYCDEMAAENTQEALDLSYLAHKYQMVHLMDGCCNYMCGSLDGNYVWQAWTLAELTSQPNLTRKCVQVIREDTENALAADGFEELPQQVIKLIVEQEELNIDSELLLINSVVRWAAQQTSNPGEDDVRPLLDPFLPYLRVLTLTAQEFADGPALQNWLTNTEKTYVFTNLALPGKIGVPQPICPTLHQRTRPLQADNSTPAPRETHVLYRPSFDTKTIFNAGRMQCLISFRASKRMWLHGLTVSTQVCRQLGENESISPCAEGQVMEYVGMGRGRRQNVLPLPPTPCTPGQSETVAIRRGTEWPRVMEVARGVDQARRALGLGRSRGRGVLREPIANLQPYIQQAAVPRRPSSNFWVATHSPPNYMEHIELNILTYDYNTTSMLATDTLLNMKFEGPKEYNMLNILKFTKPLRIEGSDDLSEKYGPLYVLCLRFLSPGYYETMESVDLLRYGTLDIKFNVAPDNCPPINHGLLKELHFSADGLYLN